MRIHAALLLLAPLMMAQPSADLAAKADAYVNSYVKAGRFQGSVLVAKGGQLILARGYGLANIELEVPNQPETKFRLGSITKQFTSAAILQLQEQGKLRVSDEIAKYLPDTPETWKGITINHLLTHTSGIPNYTDGPDYLQHMREATPVPLDFVKKFRDKPLDFQPGERFKYDNSGYFLLGIIIERVSGMKYADYLRQNVFDKVGMEDTGYDWPGPILKNRAAGYSKGKNGETVNTEFLDMGQPYAAGSLYSTVLDLYKWDRALYTAKVLTAKSREAAFTENMNGYGYGWFIEAQHGHKTVGHGGGINGFGTVIRRGIEEDAVAIALSNTDTSAVGRMGKDLLGLVLGEDVKPFAERAEITVDPKTFQRFVGKYQVGQLEITIGVEDGKLVGQVKGQGKVVLHPFAPNAFFLKEVDAEIVFNGDGKAQELILRQGGEMKGKRIE